MSALVLFQRAEMAYAGGNVHAAMDGYVKAVRKLLKDEDVTQIMPVAFDLMPVRHIDSQS